MNEENLSIGELAAKEEPDTLPEPDPTGEVEQSEEPTFNYEDEVASIEEELPELCGTVGDLQQNGRYAELRALGLSPKEAYLATSTPTLRTDGRSHLRCGVPKAASSPSFAIPKEELNVARSLFEDLDEVEIRKLYKKVTK